VLTVPDIVEDRAWVIAMGQRIDFTRARDKKWRRDKQAFSVDIPVFRRSPPLKPPPPSKASLREVAEQAIRSFDRNKIRKLPS